MVAQRNIASPTLTGADAVVAEIEAMVDGGQLAPGARLEPVRAAAAARGLAPNTVATAYRKLQDRGLIVSDGRRGTFVAKRPDRSHPSEQLVPEGLVDLATGNPDGSLLPDLGPAIGSLPTAPVLYGQQPIDGDLAMALADDITPDLGALVAGGIEPGRNLAVVGGALDGIERTLAASLRPGDRVIVEDPAYTSVVDLVVAMNLRPVPAPVDRFGVMPERLVEALSPDVAAVILTPRAQNPTGAAFDQARAAALETVLAGHPDVLIIEDDHAGPIAGQPYHRAIPETATRWAVIRSMAKSLGPDLRVAGLVGDATTVARVAERQMLGAGWVSHILQRTVAALLTQAETAETLGLASAEYQRRRQLLIDHLASNDIAAMGRSGLNVWVPVADEAAVVAGMQQRGYAIRSGARFRQDTGPAVRISTAACSPETLRDAASALVEVIVGGPRSRSV